MTVRASQAVRGTRKRLADIVGPSHCGAVLATILFCSAAPAPAQVGAAVSIVSDDRFRGFSLSDGHPVGRLALSYDSPTGLYAAASGTLVGSAADGVRPLGLELDGGYAAQVSSGLTADGGIIHARYSRYSGLRSGLSYTEVYAGLEGKILSSRIYFSPRYLGRGATAYGELNAALPLGQGFTFQGHAGVFVPLYAYSRGSRSLVRNDWQLGLSRPAGRLIFHAALGGGGPRQYYYRDYSAGHAVTFGVDCAL